MLNRISKTKDLQRSNTSQCLNLRQIQEQKYEQMIRATKGLVDLEKFGQQLREREKEQAIKNREKAIHNARHLLNLSKGEVAMPPREKLVSPVAPEKEVPKPKLKVKVVQKPQVKHTEEEIPETFPEYFELKQKKEELEQNFYDVDSKPVLPVDFLQPAIKTFRAKKKRRKNPTWRSLLVFGLIASSLGLAVGGSAAVQRTLDSQTEIMNNASSGAESLKSGAAFLKQQNWLQAMTDFESGAQYFSEAEAEIENIGELTSELIALAPQGKAAISLVQAGQSMAEAGKSFTKGLSYFRQVGSIFGGVTFGEDKLDVADALEKSQAEFAIVSDNLAIAQSNIDSVKIESLPQNFQNDFLEAKEILGVLGDATDYFTKFSGQFASIIGADGPRRYLVLLTNNDEIRGSVGGFPGSYLVLDFAEGQIKDMKFYDVYGIRGQSEEKIIPPEQFQLINGNFEFQDAAGWQIDYRDSAQQVLRYYEASAMGTTTDGMWTINAKIIEDLVKLTGPIEMAEYGMTIDENNYLKLLESEVESDEARDTGEPKKIIEDFMNKLLAKVMSEQDANWLALLGIIDGAVKDKTLQMYFTDPELQEFAEQNNAAGVIKDATDYLAVYAYNIGGGKTDDNISKTIDQASTIDESGTINTDVIITREHRSDEELDELSKVKNVSWFKVILPANAEILSVDGVEEVYPKKHELLAGAEPDSSVSSIEETAEWFYDGQVSITKEAGKKVVGFWQGLGVDESKSVQISYRIPDAVNFSKNWLDHTASLTSVIQTQPGESNSRITSRMKFPEGHDIVWQEASGAFVNNHGDWRSMTIDNPGEDIIVSSVLDY